MIRDVAAVPQPAPDVAARAWPWVRCFAERARPLPGLTPVDDGGPWRLVSGGYGPLESYVRQVFPDDPLADRTLAVVGDLDDARNIEAALLAAREGVRTGQIVAVGPGPSLAGFWATLHAEHPLTGITVVRAPCTREGLRAAKRLAVASPGTYREIDVGASGTAAEPVMVPVPLPGGAKFPFGPQDVGLISRSSGAAGLALAFVLACSGAAIAMIGGDREDGVLMAELERLQAAGARVSCEVADMNDHGAVIAAVERLQARLGRVTALCHSTSTATHCRLDALDYSDVHEELRLQAAVLDQMAAAVCAAARTASRGPVRLRHIVTFGSVIGRYGLAGHGTLALATGALADQARRLAGAFPGCRALHVDWPPFASAGIGETCAGAGITPIPVAEASRQLLRLLATDGLPGRVAVHGRVGMPAPRQIARAPGGVRDPGQAGRFIERVLAHYPGVELIAEATLSVTADPYLADYQVDDVPVLPPVMALEAMAEAAAALAGRPLRGVTEFTMKAPVVLPAGASGSGVVVRTCAQRQRDVVTVALRTGNSDFGVDHAVARFTPEPAVARRGGEGSSATLPDFRRWPRGPGAWMDGADLYGRMCFQTGRFQRLTAIHPNGSRAAIAVAYGHDRLPWFGAARPSDDRPAFALVLGSAGLNDAALQLIQACVPHRRLTLAGCESLWVSGRVSPGLVTLRVAEVGPASTDRQPAESVWNAVATDATGQPLVTWSGLRMRAAWPLAHEGPWPIPLLGSYLERAAVELGLGPGLHLELTAASSGESRLGAPQPRGRLVLTAEAAVPASAGWREARLAYVEPADGTSNSAGNWLAMLHALPIPAAVQPAISMAARQAVAAQAAALVSCVGGRAVPPDLTAQSVHVVGVNWLLLRTGDASIASTVLDVAGFGQVAFALMTGWPAQPMILVPPQPTRISEIPQIRITSP